MGIAQLSNRELTSNFEIVFDRKGLWVELQQTSNSEVEYSTAKGNTFHINAGERFLELHFTPKNQNQIDPSKRDAFIQEAIDAIPEFIEWRRNNYPDVRVLVGQTHKELATTVKKRLGFEKVVQESTTDIFGSLTFDYENLKKVSVDSDGERREEMLDSTLEAQIERIVTDPTTFEQRYGELMVAKERTFQRMGVGVHVREN